MSGHGGSDGRGERKRDDRGRPAAAAPIWWTAPRLEPLVGERVKSRKR